MQASLFFNFLSQAASAAPVHETQILKAGRSWRRKVPGSASAELAPSQTSTTYAKLLAAGPLCLPESARHVPRGSPGSRGPPALGSGGRASQVTSGSEATTACVPLGSAPNNTSVVIKTGLPSLWLYETVPGPLEEGGSEDTQECPALEANGPSYKSGFCSGSSLRVCPPPHGKQTNGQRPGQSPPADTASPTHRVPASSNLLFPNWIPERHTHECRLCGVGSAARLSLTFSSSNCFVFLISKSARKDVFLTTVGK